MLPFYPVGLLPLQGTLMPSDVTPKGSLYSGLHRIKGISGLLICPNVCNRIWLGLFQPQLQLQAMHQELYGVWYAKNLAWVMYLQSSLVALFPSFFLRPLILTLYDSNLQKSLPPPLETSNLLTWIWRWSFWDLRVQRRKEGGQGEGGKGGVFERVKFCKVYR